MSQTTEQRCKEAIKKAFTVTREGLNEAGAAGNLATALTMTAFPEVLKELLKQDGTQQAPPIRAATPITPVTPVTPIPKPVGSSPSVIPIHEQLFQQFLLKLPAELRPKFFIMKRTAEELWIGKNEKLEGPDFSAVCNLAERFGGTWVPADKESSWHLPLATKK